MLNKFLNWLEIWQKKIFKLFFQKIFKSDHGHNFCFSLMVSFVFFLIFKYDSWNTLDNDTWYFVNYKNRFVIPLLTNPWDVERDNTEAVLFFKNVDVFLKVFLTNFFSFFRLVVIFWELPWCSLSCLSFLWSLPPLIQGG